MCVSAPHRLFPYRTPTGTDFMGGGPRPAEPPHASPRWGSLPSNNLVGSLPLWPPLCRPLTASSRGSDEMVLGAVPRAPFS